MPQVRVGRTRQRVTGRGRHRTWTRFRFGGESHTMFVVTSGEVPFLDHDKGDVWLPVALILAMKRGERLVLADPISEERRAAIDRVQDIFVSWYPDEMTRVRVRAPRSDAPSGAARLRRALRPPPRRGVATCFTGGVDSFYSLLTREDVDTIVYGFGLDIPLDRRRASRRVHRGLRSIAAERGDAYLWLRTNLRWELTRDVSWGFESHGAVLASLGMVLSSRISSLGIPATHTHDADFPWGSHPQLDPLWSTGRLSVLHHGADASRAAKTVRVSGEPLAQQHLRVCYSQYRQANCGRCLKCLRTMATLELTGNLQRFELFESPLDPSLLRAKTLTTTNEIFQMRDVLRLADTVPGHDELKDALRSLVGAYDATYGPGSAPPGPAPVA